MRASASLLGLFFVALAVGGCVSRSTEDTLEASEEGPRLPPVTMDAAEVVEQNDTSITFLWKGKAALGVGTPRAVAFQSILTSAVRAPLEVPTGVPFRVNATLTWATDADLNLYVRADDQYMCSSVGATTTGDDGNENCQVESGPLTEGTEWEVAVRTYQNTQEGLPFEVLLRIDVMESAKLLGPALLEDLATGLVFDEPVLVSEDVHSGEPNVELDAEDTIYYAAAWDPHESLFRSRDRLHFEEVVIDGVPSWPRNNLDRDVAIEGTDHVYFAALTSECNVVSSTHDGGETWFNQVLVCDLPLVDRQWLATNGPDTVWLAFNGQLGATVMRSDDGGLTFPVRSYVLDDSCGARDNLVYSKATDTLYLAGCNAEGPGVAVSKDGGLTWTWHNVAPRTGDRFSGFCFTCNILHVIDADAAGNLYMVWSDPTNGRLDIWFAASHDEGQTWSAPVQVNHANGTHIMPWIAAGAEGRAAVVWYATRYEGVPDEADGEWYVHAAVTDNAHAETPVFCESLVSTDPVQFGPICTHGGSCTGNRNLLDFLEVALDSNGNAHVAYTDGQSGGSWRDSMLMYAYGET